MRGDLVVTNQRSLSLMLNWIAAMLPRRLVLKMVERSQSK